MKILKPIMGVATPVASTALPRRSVSFVLPFQLVGAGSSLSLSPPPLSLSFRSLLAVAVQRSLSIVAVGLTTQADRRHRPEAAKPPLVAASRQPHPTGATGGRRRQIWRRRAWIWPPCGQIGMERCRRRRSRRSSSASSPPLVSLFFSPPNRTSLPRRRHWPLSLSLSLLSPAAARDGRGNFFGGNGVHRPRSRPTRPLSCVPLPKASEGRVPSWGDGADDKANGDVRRGLRGRPRATHW